MKRLIIMLDEFKIFVSNYDCNNEKIATKISHSIRVYYKMMEYARKLYFNDDEVLIAGEIGLLHDIGRFKQVEISNTFLDVNSFDHAKYGVKYLFQEGNIKKFVKNKKHYEIIKFAIKNHNKSKIELCNDNDKIKFAKLIRDVDKLDILYSLGKLHEFNLKTDSSKISDNVKKTFYDENEVNVNHIESHNDMLCIELGYTFDINYDIILKEFKNNIEEYYKQINFNDILEEEYKIIIEYLNKRIKKGKK
jgi:putative nucleotidyltransferase with HDIG domain